MIRRRAKLISIEGIDCAGKTTQVKHLSRTLTAHGYAVCSFKCPSYDTALGRLIKRVLSGKCSMPTITLITLFSANRLEQREAITRAMAQKDVVLFDRYSESEYVYGEALGFKSNWLQALESQMPVSDFVFLLDIRPRAALQRVRSRSKDVFEKDTALLHRARLKYLELAKQCSHWEIVDAELRADEVHDVIAKRILGILGTSVQQELRRGIQGR